MQLPGASEDGELEDMCWNTREQVLLKCTEALGTCIATRCNTARSTPPKDHSTIPVNPGPAACTHRRAASASFSTRFCRASRSAGFLQASGARGATSTRCAPPDPSAGAPPSAPPSLRPAAAAPSAYSSSRCMSSQACDMMSLCVLAWLCNESSMSLLAV